MSQVQFSQLSLHSNVSFFVVHVNESVGIDQYIVDINFTDGSKIISMKESRAKLVK